MNRRLFGPLCVLASLAAAVAGAKAPPPPSPAETRAIAKEAFVYGFPLVDNYRLLHSWFVDARGPDFKAAWNTLFQAPPSGADASPSYVGADLRAEPIVLTMPEAEKGRSTPIQLVDLYTFNFAHAPSPTAGHGAATFLLAGPRWKGDPPAGVTKVFRSETDFVLAIFRMQPVGRDDLKVQPLSAFRGEAAPAPAPAVEFFKPLSAETEKTSLVFFEQLNFVLQFCPTHPSEKALMERFGRLGIGAGRTFDARGLSAAMRKAMEEGVGDAWVSFGVVKRRLETGLLRTSDIRGTRMHLKNNYLNRMLGAVSGAYLAAPAAGEAP